jgi:hypothetical protein
VRKISVNGSRALPSFEEPQPITPAEPLDLHYAVAKLPRYVPNSASPVRSSPLKLRLFFLLSHFYPFCARRKHHLLAHHLGPYPSSFFHGYRIMGLRESWGPRLCARLHAPPCAIRARLVHRIPSSSALAKMSGKLGLSPPIEAYANWGDSPHASYDASYARGCHLVPYLYISHFRKLLLKSWTIFLLGKRHFWLD